MVPSIYHNWFYTTLPGRHRRGCQLFRDYEPSLSMYAWVLVDSALAINAYIVQIKNVNQSGIQIPINQAEA